MKFSHRVWLLGLLVVFVAGCRSFSAQVSTPTKSPTNTPVPSTPTPAPVVKETPTLIPVPQELFVSAESCERANGPLPRLYNFEAPPMREIGSTLGGGGVESNGFTFELFLYCDPIFQPDAVEPYFRSDVGGLAIFANWRYDARMRSGAYNGFFGFEPDLRWQFGGGPYLSQGFIAQGNSVGILLPLQADLSRPTAFRFLYIIHTAAGQFAGAALSFELQRQADGVHPGNIAVAALSAEELGKMEYLKGLIPMGMP